jgi:hypothetical protein
MESRTPDPFEPRRFASGVKTASVIVILGAVALMADHAFFVTPHVRTPAALAAPAATSTAPVAVNGFALPDNLRPTAADAASAPASF